MEIGVLMDQEGHVATLESGGFIVVYAVEAGRIVKEREKEYISAAHAGASAIRESLKELSTWLGACRVLVVREVNGIYFTVLEGLLFNMWEMSGQPRDFLDYIYKSELAEREKAQRPEKIYAPVEKGRQVYFIDLEAVLNSDSGVTSKKVLLPFLNTESFKKLEVKCGHVPRWFANELEPLKLKSQTEKTDDGYLVSITPDVL
ncbi:MAG: hypothetical protein LBT32_07845 [Peptococcaceae bacterium]|jgi:Fe-only nitrogenase accessory protein AnfO|nr:hypothetical protein [Peptococcaceae bacterium]